MQQVRYTIHRREAATEFNTGRQCMAATSRRANALFRWLGQSWPLSTLSRRPASSASDAPVATLPGHRRGIATKPAGLTRAALPQPPRGKLLAISTLAVTFLLASVVAAHADHDDDEEPRLLPGIVAQYDCRGTKCVRRDDAVQFVWGEQSPDERLPPGEFSARWQGQLLVLSPGKHRFYLHAAGRVALEVAGKKLLTGESAAPRWFDSATVDLEFGHQPLTIEFTKTSAAARVGLYWSGPQFELEPVHGRLLFHEPVNDPGDAFERGAELWRALRCGNCHQQADAPGLRAPSLASVTGNLSRDWLIGWLRSDERHASDGSAPGRRMPHFNLSAEETESIADYLLGEATCSAGVSPAANEQAGRLHHNDKEQAGRLHYKNVTRGRRLFVTLGCLACHQLGDLGSAGLFGGGDLSRVADKRPPDFFARWLRDPASLNPDHRMPVFRLSDAERDDLATWLATLRSSQPAQIEPTMKHDAALGKRLVESLRCGNCHALPGKLQAAAESPDLEKLLAGAARDDWQKSCLGPVDDKHSRPGYNLPTVQREALIAYLSGWRAPAAQPSLDGRFVLRERNCLGCHARDTSEGIAPVLAALVGEGTSEDAYATQLRSAAEEMNLASLLPLLAPPALTGVGDKFLDAALADAITLRHPPLRPWLAVRMPRFNLSDDELAALTDHLTTIDRIPERPRVERALNPKALSQAGGRLVTSTGFGCTSCHQIGHSLPMNVALAAHGTDLSQIGRRIRRPWFDRWVRNPARIVPRMEMPAIQLPARGLLGDKLDNQLTAVWQVLNTPGFEPPPTGPVRVARHLGDDSPPVVITDVIELDRQVLLRPVVIGLNNRHNLAFDLSGNRLAGWWLGDTANQLTVGKGWHWEPAASNLLSNPAERPEVELLAGERTLSPEPMAGTSLSELDWLETSDDSVTFAYRLRFVDGGKPIVVHVTQRITSLNLASKGPAADAAPRAYSSPHAPRERTDHAERDADGRQQLNSPLPEGEGTDAGFRRSWQFRVPPGYTVRLRDLPAGEQLCGAGVSPADTCGAGVSPADTKQAGRLHHNGQTLFECEATYTTAEQAPPLPTTTPEAPAEAAAALSIVPGYEAIRLPLPRSEMPTGLAWRDDGRLAFCSLKGGVCLARDTDDDSLEDRLSLVADGLPAPYGIACQGDAIDVAAKSGLVRLSQLDDTGRAARMDVIASGWGYTADYHDWAIGLPRDAAGNYYIGLPCQQDNRSPADARWRGTVLKLQPRTPTAASPRRFEPDVLSAGHRFPTGLALNRRGDLFVTDNQGNYNPFNELNHVRRGARYGFINKLEAKPGFQPPFEEPAVAIPHPWTRSVNGVCFLDSPGSRAGYFGPFEGHLIGCEFDTRRLIRMSLEKVGDVYQGAAYPFSVEPAPGEPTFEGPVVCAVSPRGDLYVGNLRDSGWGGGQNTGSIVRLRPKGPLPIGIAEVRSLPDGFSIDFTGPIDAARAGTAANYAIVSYRRVSTPAYGGPDIDREQEVIHAVEVSADRRRALLHLKRMRAGFVHEFQLKNLAPKGEVFFPAEAYYTLHQIPLE